MEPGGAGLRAVVAGAWDYKECHQDLYGGWQADAFSPSPKKIRDLKLHISNGPTTPNEHS